ncbi:MAG: hypothetical protein A7316_07970 [Candidatus Altiarchaeales archaeon WOR_SM1_86-2]|nr:MAG: hypothetical protein A7316_07970 [Candidatus Altiarchaeales archaeon WOR_SM1_86-2]
MGYLFDCLSQCGDQDKKWLKDLINIVKSPYGAQQWFKDLGKNDFEHAKAVEEYLDKILSESKVKISPEEAYLLLHSIYTHDIGYRKGSKNHELHSRNMILKNPQKYFINDQELANAIALICYAHAPININEFPDNFSVDILSRTKEYDLQFLGSLLRLADEMDQGYIRVLDRIGQSSSHRNSVYHIEIGPQIIKLKTKPETEEEWNQLVKVQENIQTRLDEIRPILKKQKIKLEQVMLYPRIWSHHPKFETCSTQDKKIISDTSTAVNILLLIDKTIMGLEVFQELFLSNKYSNVSQLPLLSLEKYAQNLNQSYSSIICFLGEDFYNNISNKISEFIIKNTNNGGGAVFFPFFAWSASEGINDNFEEILPVSLAGGWHEAKYQKFSQIHKHKITGGIKPFSIQQNTFEKLTVKKGYKCIISDDETNPCVVIGSYHDGRVVYINTTSHCCLQQWDYPLRMTSPWQQSDILKRLIINCINWSIKTKL